MHMDTIWSQRSFFWEILKIKKQSLKKKTDHNQEINKKNDLSPGSAPYISNYPNLKGKISARDTAREVYDTLTKQIIK